MIRKNGFPFVLQIEKPSQETMKAIEEAIEEKDLVGPFSTADDVMDSHQRETSRHCKNVRECYIQNDWLPVYCADKEKLILTLVRTGTCSDLF